MQTRTDAEMPFVEGVSNDVHLLIADAKAMAAAEFALQKLRAAMAGKLVSRIAMLGGLALSLAYFALMALVLGALLGLATILGPWGAMAAVVGGLIVLTIACGLIAWSAVGRLRRLITDLVASP